MIEDNEPITSGFIPSPDITHYQDVRIERADSGKTTRHQVYAGAFEPPIFSEFNDIWIRIFDISGEEFYYKLSEIHLVSVGVRKPIVDKE